MAELGQEKIADPHGIEGSHTPKDDDNDTEVIIGSDEPLPTGGNKGEDDGGSESDDSKNGQVHGDQPAKQHRPRIPRGGHGPVKPQGPMGPVVPAYMNLHVKCPIFSTKDDEDAESHLLYSDDWMNSHGIVEGVKCVRFHLTLGCDSHLWYESITPVANDWNNLQRLFWRWFSKLGLTQELFQRWRSFQFDEATDTIPSYVLRLKQFAQMSGYNEGQALDLFKNILSTRYYYLLFCNQNCREPVVSYKHVMTKEKTDKELAG